MRRKWYGLVAASRARSASDSWLVRVRLDPAQRRGDAPLVAPARPAHRRRAAGERRCDRAGKAQRKLLERGAIAIVARRFGFGDQPHERGTAADAGP